MLDRCTDNAKQALQVATQRAKLQHRGLPNDVDLLIGVLADATDAAGVFQAAGIDPVRIRFEAEKVLHDGSEEAGHDRFNDVLAVAILKSQQCRHREIGTEHLLFGLLSDDSGALSALLADLGIARRRLDRTVIKCLSRLPAEKPPKPLPQTPPSIWERQIRLRSVVLSRGIGARIVTGVASLFVLPLGVLGCGGCILAFLSPAIRRNGGLSVAAALAIAFELCLSITLTGAASLIWAVAAPKWLEKFLQSLIKKTTRWLVVFLLFILGCAVIAIVIR